MMTKTIVRDSTNLYPKPENRGVMKTYAYNELVPEGEDPVRFATEDEIIKTYWPHWQGLMIKRFGADDPRITKENCIDDWAVVFWAWEVKKEQDDTATQE